MADWSPTNNSLELLEFTNHNRTISVVETSTKQYQIHSVSYTTSNGITFDDLVITSSTKSFNFRSLFEYAVNRRVLLMEHNDFNSPTVNLGEVNNIKFIPPETSSSYQFDNPDDSMTVYFHIKGLQRDGTQGTSGDGTSTTIIWSNWYSWEDTYNVIVETNFNKHIQLIRQAVKQQQYVQNLKGTPQYPNID